MVGGHFFFLSSRLLQQLEFPGLCRSHPTPPPAAAIAKTFVLRRDLIALTFNRSISFYFKLLMQGVNAFLGISPTFCSETEMETSSVSPKDAFSSSRYLDGKEVTDLSGEL